jgi:hypothetical protein
MIQCELCNKKHDGAYGSGRFCSRSCSNTFVSRQNREEKNLKTSCTIKSREHHKSSICKYCGRLFSNARQLGGHIQGCRKGETNLAREQKILKVLNGKVVWTGQLRDLKRYLLKYDLKSEKCEVCGIKNWMEEPISFELHHVDGDCHNNVQENLLMICPNCHSQTSTFKRRNRFSTRVRGRD